MIQLTVVAEKGRALVTVPKHGQGLWTPMYHEPKRYMRKLVDREAIKQTVINPSGLISDRVPIASSTTAAMMSALRIEICNNGSSVFRIRAEPVALVSFASAVIINTTPTE